MSTFLLALDSFKNSIRSHRAAHALAQGLGREGVDPQHIDMCPIADGGEGTLEALMASGGGELVTCQVRDAEGEAIQARYWRRGASAWVEMAQAAGLEGVRGQPAARRTTAGVGQLIQAALQAGATEITLACGGSSTVDAGLGMLEALGARVDLSSPRVGLGGCALGDLAALRQVDLTQAQLALQGVRLRAAVDVESPLGGPRGAILYAPQKGVPPEALEDTRRALEHAGQVLERASGQSLLEAPGAGAAGGISAAVLALGGELVGGFSLLGQALELERRVSQAHFILTGEGSLDATTRHGKVVRRILELAQRHQVPAAVVAGRATPEGVEVALELGAVAVWTLARGGQEDAQDAMAAPQARLEQVGRQAARWFSSGRSLR